MIQSVHLCGECHRLSGGRASSGMPSPKYERILLASLTTSLRVHGQSDGDTYLLQMGCAVESAFWTNPRTSVRRPSFLVYPDRA